MFGSKDSTTTKTGNIKAGNIDTLLGEACSIKGDITSKSSIKLDGHIEGNLSSQGIIIVAQKGRVHGDVSAKELVVYGSIDGSIHADALHLQPTARINGDINTKTLQIEVGAVYQGAVNMKQELKTVSQQALNNQTDKTAAV